MMLLESYETIGDETPRLALDALRKYGDACEWLLDDYLVKMLLDRVPKMVAHLSRFNAITVPVLPSADVNGYLREAFVLTSLDSTRRRSPWSQRIGIRSSVPHSNRL
jgi:hypothetical protein